MTNGSEVRIGRDLVTPVTAVLFLVSTITGIMLLLHWHGRFVHTAHVWLSVVFSAVAIWHLVHHWRSFLGYLHRPASLAAIGVAVIVSIIFTLATVSPPRGERGGPPLADAAASAPATLAER